MFNFAAPPAGADQGCIVAFRRKQIRTICELGGASGPRPNLRLPFRFASQPPSGAGPVRGAPGLVGSLALPSELITSLWPHFPRLRLETGGQGGIGPAEPRGCAPTCGCRSASLHKPPPGLVRFAARPVLSARWRSPRNSSPPCGRIFRGFALKLADREGLTRRSLGTAPQPAVAVPLRFTNPLRGFSSPPCGRIFRGFALKLADREGLTRRSLGAAPQPAVAVPLRFTNPLRGWSGSRRARSCRLAGAPLGTHHLPVAAFSAASP
jgi:hypothetical protein